MMEGTNTAANKVANTAGLAGLRDKVDVINGAVVEAGHRHNIPVPTHEFVVELVHAMEGRA